MSAPRRPHARWRRGCARKRVRRPSRPQAQSAACRHGKAGARHPVGPMRDWRRGCARKRVRRPNWPQAQSAARLRAEVNVRPPRRPYARLAARLRAEVNVRPSSQPHGRSAARLPFQSATCTICGAAACGSGRGKRSSARCASKSADEFRPRWAGPERAFNGRGRRRRLQYAKSRGSVRGSAYKRTRGRIPRRSFRAWRARRAGAVRCRR